MIFSGKRSVGTTIISRILGVFGEWKKRNGENTLTKAPAPDITAAAALPAPPQALPAPQTAAPREDEADDAPPITGCDLSALDCLTQPSVRDPFEHYRPRFTTEALQLSLELSYMAYTLNIDPWLRAGWRDFSVQIDSAIKTGARASQDMDKAASQESAAARRFDHAKSILSGQGMVRQLVGTVRQLDKSDTVKVVCMIHPLANGRFLLAIGFMGTTRRLNDWIANFRFTLEEGFHRGFYQLSACLERSADRISFPETTAMLGMKRLTLMDILRDMRRENSRFSLWMSGHSQGSAVMQVFTHHLIHHVGVKPSHIIGYGFASPSVASGAMIADPAAYPLYHILNSDDIVPRAGSIVHLGVCLEYPADDAYRLAAYSKAAGPRNEIAEDALRPLFQNLNDTPSIMIFMVALLQCVADERCDSKLYELMERWWSITVIDQVFLQTENWINELMARVSRTAQKGYQDLTGRPMPQEEILALCGCLRPIVKALPIKELGSILSGFCFPPHQLYNKNENEGAYYHIAMKAYDKLRPYIWIKNAEGAAKRYSAASIHTMRAGHARRMPPRRAGFMGRQRVSLSARQSRHGKA